MASVLSPTPADADVLDDVFHALSDRTRRAILHRLAERPTTVGELAGPFDMTLPAVSKHVKVLERAGLLSRTVDGRLHRCSLDPAALRPADEWLAPYRDFWAGQFEALDRHLRREIAPTRTRRHRVGRRE